MSIPKAEYDAGVLSGKYSKRGRPPGVSPKNKGVSCRLNRKPARTAVPALKTLFAMLDDDPRSMSVVAEKVGLSKVTLSYWRHGARTPNIWDVTEVGDQLGYELVWRQKSPETLGM